MRASVAVLRACRNLGTAQGSPVLLVSSHFCGGWKLPVFSSRSFVLEVLGGSASLVAFGTREDLIDLVSCSESMMHLKDEGSGPE